MQLKPTQPQLIYIAIFTLLTIAINIPQPAYSQEQKWVEETFNLLDSLASEQRMIPVSNDSALDTEIPGDSVKLIFTRLVKVRGHEILSPYTSIMCGYDAVRQGTHIPVRCYRVLSQEGYDYRISATVYDLNGRQGIPADRQKRNGALQAGHAKELQLIIENVEAVGTIGHLWTRVTNGEK
ncbi:hypothetical protein [Thalassospira xiamenensis]|jgi:hypothetical protein|uniref:hypothetical protein n=1 Tax=Thalassospira xiamenensis TaxID=220697 RepID=UPI000E818115|nr:hypothetical protein [Thalassospira xiamenensis]HBN49342.1 hypothetical protein [Thalassospira sp.]|tara:strand:- start:199 stop:741 length:543 start_codon:yes stop_codon:yes gene_type:complete